MPTCIVPTCTRTARSISTTGQRICLMHWKRWKRNGSFEETRPWSPPNKDRQPCLVDGCETLEDGTSGYCKMHDTRRRRHGDPRIVIAPADREVPRLAQHWAWTGDEATYEAAHQRVHAQRGQASNFDCLDCGAKAAHWSYDRSDPAGLASPSGPYSLDSTHYAPRCVSCHKRFDLAAIRTQG